MKKILTSIFFLTTVSICLGQTVFRKDFDFYWKTINDNYAYFDKQNIDWAKAKTIFQPLADTCKTERGFIHLLEMANHELYNGHSFLNVNTQTSNRSVPTGADVKLIYKNRNFVIDEIRQASNAEMCGLKKDMEVISFNNQPIKEAIKAFLPKAISSYNTAMYEYAANLLLAGTRDKDRKITVLVNGQSTDFYPDVMTWQPEESLLDWKKLENNIGYIRLNNSLGENDLIWQFDTVLNHLFNTDGLILDLRETPSGGNTTIARAIMGRFTDQEMPYQKHLYIAEERETGVKRTTLELVSPRQKIYTKPLVILVGYWTGSMGEGMTIGFDAMKRVQIVGTKMAGLLGEIYTFETPELKIPFSFPCVQLQSVTGQPREDFVPQVQVKNQEESLPVAVKLLSAKKKK